jgi:hypothetical protein
MPTLSELQLGALQARAQKLARKASPAADAAHPPILRFSLEPLSALKEMTVKGFKGGVAHLGRYILLRVVSDPVNLKGSVNLQGLSAIVQDKAGSHCCLTIHDHGLLTKGAAEPGAAALRKGSVLAVKVRGARVP